MGRGDRMVDSTSGLEYMDDGTGNYVRTNTPAGQSSAQAYGPKTGASGASLADIAKNQALGYGAKQAGSYLANSFGSSAGSQIGSQLGPTLATAGGNPYAAPGAEALTSGGGSDIAALGSGGAQAAPSALSVYGPGAAGAYGLYNLAQNRKRIGTGSGFLQAGASGAGIGATIGSVVPGIGTVIGAGVGGGLGLLANAFGIGHQSRTKGEEHLRSSLADQGINVENADTKEWENNQAFHDSRKESDLTGGDIKNAAQFYSNYAPLGYDKASDEVKSQIGDEALKRGLIREEKGQIDVNANDDFNKFVQSKLGGGEAPSSVGKSRRRAALSDLVKEPALDKTSNYASAPRYDLNPSPLIKNPYL